ncbi:MAG: hypothetical protein CR997_01365 [Acidobacteria bacterium]|nr:MAG: hypothetical protein CR997_01365 [Acidobacteriota bacterium]
MNWQEIVHSRTLDSKTGEPFSACHFCGKSLNHGDFYVIAKAFDKGRLVMEAVQCLACQQNASGYISAQSAENIQLFAGKRFVKYMEQDDFSGTYEPVEVKCLFTDEELSVYDSVELYSMHMPWSGDQPYFFVGPTAIEMMSDLLSEETRKFWERYMEQLDPVSPEHVLSPMFLK